MESPGRSDSPFLATPDDFSPTVFQVKKLSQIERARKAESCKYTNFGQPLPAFTYEIRPRKDGGGFDLISEALPFGRLWYQDAAAAVGYAKFYSRSHKAEIRVIDVSGNVIKTHRSEGEFREP